MESSCNVIEDKQKSIFTAKFFIVILFIVIIVGGGVYIKSSDILHISDRVYSPDKSTKQVVYIYKNNSIIKDTVKIKIYDNSGRNITSISFSGIYGGIFWTSDSSKYVIKAKEYISNIFVVNGKHVEITGIDDSLDLALRTQVNNNVDKFDFSIDEKPDTDYEFIKWEKDNESMLIYYEINDLDNNVHSGYFLYDYKDNKINEMIIIH